MRSGWFLNSEDFGRNFQERDICLLGLRLGLPHAETLLESKAETDNRPEDGIQDIVGALGLHARAMIGFFSVVSQKVPTPLFD